MKQWWIEEGGDCDPIVWHSAPRFPNEALHVVEFAEYERLRVALAIAANAIYDPGGYFNDLDQMEIVNAALKGEST